MGIPHSWDGYFFVGIVAAWIPYVYDNDVYAGIAAGWLIGFAAWALLARKRRRPGGAYGRAFVGTIAGAFICLIVYTGYILARQDMEVGQSEECEYHMRVLGAALLQYAQTHHDRLPPADEWATDVMPYIPPSERTSAFHCPVARAPYSYAFNTALGSLSMDAIPDPSETVMLFECDAETLNTNGTVSDMCPARHEGTDNYVFADGRVKRYPREYAIAHVKWRS